MAKNDKKRRLTQSEVSELITMENELKSLKEEHNIQDQGSFFDRLMLKYYAFKEKHTHRYKVNRKTYLRMHWLGIFGGHHFYARHYIKGIIYLLICWTGISGGLTLIDWMQAVPMKADEDGNIEI